MEARMQAELLYALRAITRYMTWSAVLVFLFDFFLPVVDVGQKKNVKTTKNGKNKTEEEEERAAAEDDDKLVLLKEGKERKEKKKQLSTEPTCWITCVAAQPAVPNLATGWASEQNPSIRGQAETASFRRPDLL